MRRALVAAAALAALPALAAHEPDWRHELIGQLGSRSVLMTLAGAPQADGSWHVSGEYWLLQTFARRVVEGERSAALGVTVLREAGTPVVFGRTASATLQGAWKNGVFRGTRYAPGGQERESFELSEAFPSMEAYAASVECEAREPGYSATLSYTAQAGALERFEWRVRVGQDGPQCALGAAERLQPQAMKGGLRYVSADARCTVTLRDLGEYVRVSAGGCAARCAAPAAFEPLLVDRRGACYMLRPYGEGSR